MNTLDNLDMHVRNPEESKRIKEVLLDHLTNPQGYDQLMEDLYPEDKYE